MCINYTSLNKACLKDEYPLPRICQIVDFTASCELLSFLDAYSCYHQINLAVDDEENTAFITQFGIYCYTKMAFGLKIEEPRIRSVFTSYWSLKLGETLKPTLMTWR
jgi:hypothetical protein